METKIVKIGDLIIDPKLIAIRHVNPVFVSRYSQVYRNDPKAMPLLLIDSATNRVVSGNHRLTAMKKEFPDDYEIKVYWKHYSSEKEVLKDFASENANHGNAMDNFTRKKLISALCDAGATAEEISRIFNIPVKGVEKLGEGQTKVDIGGGVMESKPVKRGFEPPANRPPTKKEYEEHVKKDRGLPLHYMTGQLNRWLIGDHIAITESNINTLTELKKNINEFFKRHKAEIKNMK